MSRQLHCCPHCGTMLTKARSAPMHRRFFALVAAAFSQWPERATFRPDDAEHLRSWLLCKVNYRQSREIEVAYSEGNPELTRETAIAIEAALKEAGAHAFIRPHPDGGSVAVYRAKSLAWDKCDQKEFGPVAEAVEAIIEAELGVTADTLLKETERAA